MATRPDPCHAGSCGSRSHAMGITALPEPRMGPRSGVRASLGQGLGVSRSGRLEMGWCSTKGSIIPTSCTPCAKLCCWDTNPACWWLLGTGEGIYSPTGHCWRGLMVAAAAGGGLGSVQGFGHHWPCRHALTSGHVRQAGRRKGL